VAEIGSPPCKSDAIRKEPLRHSAGSTLHESGPQMQKVIKWFFLCGLACAFSTPAEANFVTGNYLLDTCEKTDKVSDAFCMGTILAYYDMLYEMEEYCGDGSQRTGGQIRDIVVKFLREHPEHRDTRASGLSFIAITEAFNCKLPKGRRE
jgi:hypothetical protein